MITRTSLTTVLYHREIPYADTSLCIGEQFGYREKRPIERSREDKKTAFRRRRGDARPSVSAISLPDRRIAFICVNIYIQARLTCALETRERKTESERERERERGGGGDRRCGIAIPAKFAPLASRLFGIDSFRWAFLGELPHERLHG